MTYQALISALEAEFPGHHLEVELWPAGGSIRANACDECGGKRSESVTWRYDRIQKMEREKFRWAATIDEAIARLKAELAEG